MDKLAAFRCLDSRQLFDWLRANLVDEEDAKILLDNKFTGEALYLGFKFDQLLPILNSQGIASGVSVLIQLKIQALSTATPTCQPAAPQPSQQAAAASSLEERPKKRKYASSMLVLHISTNLLQPPQYRRCQVARACPTFKARQ